MEKTGSNQRLSSFSVKDGGKSQNTISRHGDVVREIMPSFGEYAGVALRLWIP
jgi:hypothetical protein